MTPADAARVLTKAAAFDQRTVGAADAIVWAEALDEIGVDDALEAVTRHYRGQTDRLMPAHVRRHVEQMRRDRTRVAVAAAADKRECQHGQPGGSTLHPTTRLPLCALCRTAAGRAEATRA